MRRFFICLLIPLMLLYGTAACEEAPVRLHVVSQNDTEDAQRIKLYVKDKVLLKARGIAENAQNAQEAYLMLFSSVEEIRSCARDAAAECGFTGEIQCDVTREYFPARLYGEMLLKEGEYPCVSVKIAEAKGKNWWCVIFPDLCLYGEKTKDDRIVFYSKLGLWINRWLDWRKS